MSWSAERRAAFAAAVQRGSTVKQLMAEFNLAERTVRWHIADKGLKAKPRERYSCDTNFAMTRSMADALLTIAYRRGGNLSAVIREACQEYLDAHMRLPQERDQPQAPLTRVAGPGAQS